MRSSVNIVDNQGNLMHIPLSARVTNPANSMRHVIGLNNSTPRHISQSANTDQNEINILTSLYQTQHQQRTMTRYTDSGDAINTCAHCQAKYWYGERMVRHSSTSNPRFSTCCSEGKVVFPLLCHTPPLLTELMDYNGEKCFKLFQKKLKLLNSMMAKDSDGNLTDSHDVIVEERGNEHNRNPVKRNFELHPNFMALQYPLLFPYGEYGFQLHIPLNVPQTTKRKYLSLREYYCFSLQIRVNEGKTLHKARSLFHTFCVDTYTAVLDHDLDWYK
ncbi:hypothetical protein Tco_0117265 [Tanacetum coccineum]